MKFRTDFVTNSSSSSFICDICGGVESGCDAGLSELEMTQCENDHTYHNECNSYYGNNAFKSRILKNIEYYKKTANEERLIDLNTIEAIVKSNENDTAEAIVDLIYEEYYEIPRCLCPVCTLQQVNKDDMLNYLIKKDGRDLAKIEEEIKNKFVNLDEFEEYIK